MTSHESDRLVRIGVLGAAKIISSALARPALALDGVAITALAARDPTRAARAADRLGIPTVHQDYQALLADARIDALYLPLPASSHAEWTIAAVDAGKHVLTEKPFAANADEAASVAQHASRSGLIVMEAYHTGHHPNTARLREIIDSGELGEVYGARASFFTTIPPGRDIRWNPDLGGGALLDIGYYPVRMLRDLFEDAAGTTVLAAKARTMRGIDRALTATLGFGALQTDIACGMWSARLFEARLMITGTRGSLRMTMPYHPQHGRILVTTDKTRWIERPTPRTSYSYQLEAFRNAIATGVPVTTDANAATTQLRVIDDIYHAAGLEPRRHHQTLSRRTGRRQ